MNFFKLLSEFCNFESEEKEPLTRFFLFLELKYPSVWQKLNLHFADNGCFPEFPRLHLTDWDSIVKRNSFDIFLLAFYRNQAEFLDQEFGTCYYCQKETSIDYEHQVTASFDFGPVIKFYENQSMDGSISQELLVCRECKINQMKKVLNLCDVKEQTFVVFGRQN